jgi:hypothetical protein
VTVSWFFESSLHVSEARVRVATRKLITSRIRPTPVRAASVRVEEMGESVSGVVARCGGDTNLGGPGGEVVSEFRHRHLHDDKCGSYWVASATGTVYTHGGPTMPAAWWDAENDRTQAGWAPTSVGDRARWGA